MAKWLGLCLGFLAPSWALAAVLGSFAAVRALSTDEAAQGGPVAVEAIVLGFDPGSETSLFLHDGTAGCYVKLAPGASAPRCAPGDRVRVEGRAMLLGYYPSVGSARLVRIGAGALPLPVRLTPDDLFAPELDSAWVEVPAVVVGFQTADQRFTLDLEVYGLPLKAELPLPQMAEERGAALLQQHVQLRGVLGTIFNRQRQMTDRHLFVPSLEFLVPVPSSPSGGPPLRLGVAQLLTAGTGRRTLVALTGAVTQVALRGFWLRDDSGSTFVHGARAERLQPGARVRVEGFGDVAPFRPVFRATRVTVLAPGEQPTPVPFRFAEPGTVDLQHELVVLEADYLGRRESREEVVLQCRRDEIIFEAMLPRATSAAMPSLAAGDRLRLVGICELTTTHALPRVGWVDGFRLELAQAEAITVLARSPWWTVRRLAIALGIMTTLAAAVAFGNWVLRRQVRRQLAIISDSLRSEAVGKERDRIARDLHDSLEQQLAGIALQLDGLDATVKTDPGGALKALGLAKRMLRFTRLDARRSVWDLRSTVLEQEGLIAALQHLAETSRAEAGPVVEVRATAGRSLPSLVEFQLFRIAQEAVANALKHAGARTIVISLAGEARTTVLTVRDDGRGFDAAAKDPSGPHFGLLGMRERAGKIGAEWRLETAPGNGCTITVTLPTPSGEKA